MIKNIYYLSLLFVLIATKSFAQFEVSIELINTNVCHDSVTFIAKTTNGGIPELGVSYKWNFDDGSSVQSGLSLDTIKHPFIVGGGYIVRVEASKGIDEDYALKRVQVSLTADFSETESDRPDPICLGQLVSLTGIANTVDWKYEISNENKESNPDQISQGNNYSSLFDYKYYTEFQKITVATDLDTVGIKLEHTSLSNLKIELSCANESSIILKDFGGEDKYFGEPIDDEASAEQGTGYYYYWTNSPDFGTMNTTTTGLSSLPEGSYISDEPFSNLIGCSLNGQWTITVTDNQAPDKGFVFATQLKFNDALLPVDWEFENTFGSLVWDGHGISQTIDGIANGKPPSLGNTKYLFQVTDNFSCKQDTSIFINVEGASFTANPIEGPFDLEVTFENTTSWATDYTWDFGDESEIDTQENPTNMYKYPDGTYIVIFTAKTDDGCEDVDSTTITITIPDPIFNEPANVFSPNNDGANDFFNLDVEDIASLEGWIYSRWGNTVCRWRSVEEALIGWDGRIQDSNREAAPGVYYYYIKALDYHGEKIFKKGSVHLFR